MSLAGGPKASATAPASSEMLSPPRSLQSTLRASHSGTSAQVPSVRLVVRKTGSENARSASKAASLPTEISGTTGTGRIQAKSPVSPS